MNNLALMAFLVFVLVSCSEQQSSNTESSKERGLSTNHAKEFDRDIIQIENNIFVAIGYALANVIMIVGDNENIIVDTAGSEESAKKIKKEFDKISTKPINNIIYTHNHPDHIGGATIFASDSNVNVYGQENILYNICLLYTSDAADD